MKTERLDKLVSIAFHISRRDAKDRIARGKIKVNGAVCRDASEHFENDVQITNDGQNGEYRRYVYIMMNKPEGVVSAAKDAVTPTALSLLPPEMMRHDLFIAGRLDKNTTGFLLITNDGAFAHDILAPKKHIPKTYLATVTSDLRESDITAFSQGIAIGDERCKPARLTILSKRSARVTIEEGKFHQIKRMFHAVGNEVVTLKREKMGDLPLDPSLLPGQARYISEEELRRIKTQETVNI